eukprot:253937-Prymnesium_polylepis.1
MLVWPMVRRKAVLGRSALLSAWPWRCEELKVSSPWPGDPPTPARLSYYTNGCRASSPSRRSSASVRSSAPPPRHATSASRRWVGEREWRQHPTSCCVIHRSATCSLVTPRRDAATAAQAVHICSGKTPNGPPSDPQLCSATPRSRCAASTAACGMRTPSEKHSWLSSGRSPSRQSSSSGPKLHVPSVRAQPSASPRSRSAVHCPRIDARSPAGRSSSSRSSVSTPAAASVLRLASHDRAVSRRAARSPTTSSESTLPARNCAIGR